MKIRFVVFLFLSLGVFSAKAEFKVPPLQGPVMDLAGMLSGDDQAYLEDLIRRLYDRGHVQLQVLTVASLDGTPIEEASIAVVDRWKLGNKKQDNGILLMVSRDDHKVRIEVGQGLEGAVPDLYTHRIIEELMVPEFRAGNPGQGIRLAVLKIASYVNEEFKSESDAAEDARPVQQSSSRGHHAERGQAISWIFLVLLILIVSRFRGGGSGFLLGAMLGSLGGGGGRNEGFGGGGGWSGGGGGFSGGGSSGSW